MPVASVNDVDLYYERFGSIDDPVLVLIAGLGSQSTNYPDEWVAMFVDAGLAVVRFDNRDCGLSSGPPEGESYQLADMADDVIGLLDGLDIPVAHLWGSSMGGMIAQTAAISHPERVLTLTSVQSTTGEGGVGQPDPGFLDALIESMSPPADRAAAIDAGVSLAKMLINNTDVFDEAEQQRRYAAFYDRAFRPEGTARQAAAVMSAPERSAGLASLPVPALVIHGTRDRLIDISGGRRTAELIPNSVFVEVEGMGHDLSRAFWHCYVDVTVGFIAENSP